MFDPWADMGAAAPAEFYAWDGLELSPISIGMAGINRILLQLDDDGEINGFSEDPGNRYWLSVRGRAAGTGRFTTASVNISQFESDVVEWLDGDLLRELAAELWRSEYQPGAMGASAMLAAIGVRDG